MVLMLITAFITLFMKARIGPTMLGQFGFIHLFSFSVFITVPVAFIAAKQGNIKRHKACMVGLYVGGMLIAGGFTLLSGRFLHEIFFS